MLLDRYWVNQPSTHQPAHRYHGLLVIAPYGLPPGNTVTVAPITGAAKTMQLPPSALSRGWPDHLRTAESEMR